jgi:hypothetical protein
MAIRIAEVAKLSYIDETLWFYRKHSDTQSSNHTLRRWKTGIKILDKACKRYPYSFNIRRRRFAVLYFRIGQCHLAEKRIFKVIIYFLAAAILDPIRSIKVVLGKEIASSAH